MTTNLTTPLLNRLLSEKPNCKIANKKIIANKTLTSMETLNLKTYRATGETT